MSIAQTHVVQALQPGGIESLAVNLAGKGGDALRLVSLNGSMPDLAANWLALHPVASSITAFAKAAGVQPGLIFRLARHFRATKTQAVVTHHVGPFFYAGIAARLAGVPVVAHVEHDAWHYQDKKRRRLGQLLMALVRPRLAAVSQTVADGVTASIGHKAVVIPNGADLERFQPRDRAEMRNRLGLPLGRKLIGCAGRLEHVKGFDLLIDAMAQLEGDAIAVIFGTGSQEQALKDKAQALGIGRRVIFAGLSTDMENVYPAFDVFCLPSRFEGLPLAALEAQACGIPVVGFEVGGVGEAVCPASGRLVPAGDTRALAAALASALRTPVAVFPRDFIRNHFSFDQTVRAYAELTRI